MFKNSLMIAIFIISFCLIITIDDKNRPPLQKIIRTNTSNFTTNFTPESSDQIFYYFYQVEGNGDVEIKVTYPYQIKKFYAAKYARNMSDDELLKLDEKDIYSTGNPYYTEVNNNNISYQLFTVDKSMNKYVFFKFSVPKSEHLNNTELILQIFLNESSIYVPIANSVVIGCILIFAIYLCFRKK